MFKGMYLERDIPKNALQIVFYQVGGGGGGV